MTLVEFLAPLKRNPRKDKILAVLYFRARYQGVSSMTVEGIRAGLRRARVPDVARINIADILSKSGELVDTAGTGNGKRLWKLTATGEKHVKGILGIPDPGPELEREAGALVGLAQSISSGEVRDYVEEAIRCLQVNALRACVVFLWSGAIRAIEEELVVQHSRGLTAALRVHYPKARAVSRVEDFTYINDKTTLLAAEELGVFDKNERGVLEECLTLRNRSGHPSKYRPGPKRVASFVEDLVNVVLSKA